jgi:hypothetical protein
MLKYCCLAIACLVASPSLAQDSKKSAGIVPTTDPGSVLDFGNVALAQVSADKQAMRFSIPKFKFELKTRTFQKTVFDTETRTKPVKRPDGQSQDVAYTVQVPRTETHEQQYTARTPDGVTRLSVPLNQLRAWDISGNPIATNQLGTKLSNTTAVLAIENEPGVAFTPIDPYYSRILRPETIVIYLPPGASATFADKTPNTK